MEYVIIPLAALTVSCLTLFSGFGLGTLLMPVFALFFPIETAERRCRWEGSCPGSSAACRGIREHSAPLSS